MESRAYAWAAGLFTLLLGLGVLVAATWFSGETYERKYYVVETHSPVTGLNPQSTVRLRGVDVGKVETIDFADGNASVILVRIAVRADTPISASTIAQLRPQGITGLSYIMLDERTERTGALPAVGAGRIPMRPSFTEEVADTAQALLVDARARRTVERGDERPQSRQRGAHAGEPRERRPADRRTHRSAATRRAWRAGDGGGSAAHARRRAAHACRH